jgi:hypothetical protein
MRIPPPGAGTTRIVPREISRRMMSWTSGRWAFAWNLSPREHTDSCDIAAVLHHTRGDARSPSRNNGSEALTET